MGQRNKPTKNEKGTSIMSKVRQRAYIERGLIHNQNEKHKIITRATKNIQHRYNSYQEARDA